MQENRPFLPGEIERALQFFYICHYTETAQGVGMIKGCRQDRGRLRDARLAAGRQFQECLCRLSRQVVRHDQQRILGCRLDVVEPLGRHAIAE